MDTANKKQKLIEKINNDDIEIAWEEEIDSTNELSTKLALEGKENVVVADVQSKGAGRLGRTFVSEKGGLYESIAVCINDIFPEGEQPDIGRTLHFPLICALSAMHAIEKVIDEKTGIDMIPDIKWPNDLLINGNKISGILCKAAQAKGKWFIICGIGINIFNHIPYDIENAASISDLIDLNMDDAEKDELMIDLAAELAMEVFKNLKQGIVKIQDFLDEIEEHCITINKQVEVPERGVSGNAVQIGDDGSLCIRTNSGEYEIIKSGDVVIYIE